MNKTTTAAALAFALSAAMISTAPSAIADSATMGDKEKCYGVALKVKMTARLALEQLALVRPRGIFKAMPGSWFQLVPVRRQTRLHHRLGMVN